MSYYSAYELTTKALFLSDDELNLTDKSILAILCKFVNYSRDKEYLAYPDPKLLQRLTEREEQSLRNYLKKLRRLHYIRVIQRPDLTGKPNQHVYVINANKIVGDQNSIENSVDNSLNQYEDTGLNQYADKGLGDVNQYEDTGLNQYEDTGFIITNKETDNLNFNSTPLIPQKSQSLSVGYLRPQVLHLLNEMQKRRYELDNQKFSQDKRSTYPIHERLSELIRDGCTVSSALSQCLSVMDYSLAHSSTHAEKVEWFWPHMVFGAKRFPQILSMVKAKIPPGQSTHRKKLTGAQEIARRQNKRRYFENSEKVISGEIYE